jgi:hypothetical protein
LPASAALFALLFTLLLPAASRALAKRTAALAGAACILFAALAALAQPFSPDNPKHENFVLLLDADQRKGQWLVEGQRSLDPAVRAAAQFGEKPEAPYPWLPRYKAFIAPGPALALDPPRLDDVQVSGRTVRARLRSPRGAPKVGLLAPSDRVRALRFDGQRPAELTTKNLIAMSPWALQGMTDLRWETMTPEGVAVELEVEGDGPLEVVLWDQSPGLPAEGSKLLAARAADACAFQDGDRVIAMHRTRIDR